MSAFPSSTDITGTPTNAMARSWFDALHAAITGLVGTDGTVATALATLKAPFSAYAAKTATYAVVDADRGKVIDATSGTFSITLLAASTAGAGFTFIVRNSGTGTITIDPDSSETIDGAATRDLTEGQACVMICTGSGWVTVGLGSGGGFADTNYNLKIGDHALSDVTTGSFNTAFGDWALHEVTTGYYNVAIGRSAGGAITTGSTNSALGDHAGYGIGTYSNCSCVGYMSDVTGSNQVQLGDSATTPYVWNAVQNRSDERDKTAIRPCSLGLEFILRLDPVDFKWNYREDYKERLPDGTTIMHENDGSKSRTRYHHGLIAQQVKQVMDNLDVDFGGYQDHSVKGGQDVLSIGYQEFIAPTIKAIQEINTRLIRLEETINNGG